MKNILFEVHSRKIIWTFLAAGLGFSPNTQFSFSSLVFKQLKDCSSSVIIREGLKSNFFKQSEVFPLVKPEADISSSSSYVGYAVPSKRLTEFNLPLAEKIYSSNIVSGAFFSTKATDNISESATSVIYYLSINESLKDFMLAELSYLNEAKWQLVAPDGASMSGEGTTLADYIFNQSGSYSISFSRVHQHSHHGPACDHYHMPDQISIVVNSQKIEFLCETLSTSKPIVGSQPTSGITLTIQVNITGTDVPMPQLIRSTGVETTILAALISQTTLSQGLHTLTYELSGQGLPESYISFDFPDANGHLSACVYTQKL